MNNEEIIDKVRAYQNAGFVHPLTCGNNSRHRILEPKEEDEKVVLVCLDCDYRQENIPGVVFSDLDVLRPPWMKKEKQP